MKQRALQAPSAQTDANTRHSARTPDPIPGAPTSNKRLRIRRARIEDIDALLAIESRCFGSGPYRNHRFDRRRYRYYLGNSHALILLGLLDGEPAASLTALAGRGTRSRSCRILSIAVTAPERRKGLGRCLLMKSLRTMRERGCLRAYLEAAQAATHALSFFRSVGFKNTRRLPDYYGPSTHGIRMVLKLAPCATS